LTFADTNYLLLFFFSNTFRRFVLLYMKGRNLLFDRYFSSSALVSIVKTSPAIRDNCLFVFYREISILPRKAIATNSFVLFYYQVIMCPTLESEVSQVEPY